MHKVLRSAIAAIILCTSAIAVVAPVAVFAVSDDCDSAQANSRHMANFEDIPGSGPSTRVFGIQSQIDAPSNAHFDVCNGPEALTHKGAFAYVSIEPGSGNTTLSRLGAIIQIGIANCEAWNNPDYCEGTGHRFFYAVGGCGHETVRNLGVADNNAHTYRIESWYDNGITYMRGYIDGQVRFSIHQDHSHIDCWIGQDTRGAVAVETWDGGDSVGSPTAKVLFSYGSYRIVGGAGWAWTDYPVQSNCQYNTLNDTLQNTHACRTDGPRSFNTYSLGY